MKKKLMIFYLMIVCGESNASNQEALPPLKPFLYDQLQFKLNKDFEQNGEIKTIIDSIDEKSTKKDIVSFFSFGLQNSFLKPLMVKMEKIQYLNSFLEKKFVEAPKKDLFLEAVNDYINNFELLKNSLNLPIISSPDECIKKACNEALSDRWSLIVHNYLTDKPAEKFTNQKDAERAFAAIVKNQKGDFLVKQSDSTIRTINFFKNFLTKMFTNDNDQAINVLSTYSKNFTNNSDVQGFIYKYLSEFTKNRSMCDGFKQVLDQIKKPELLAQFLYFLLTVPLQDRISQLNRSFQNYLASSDFENQKNVCFEVFSNFLLKIKRSTYFEKILLAVSEIPQFSEKAKIDYVKLIKTKISALESIDREKRIKEHLNQFYSFLAANKIKLGLFATAFFALYFEHLQKALKRVKALKLFKKQQK